MMVELPIPWNHSTNNRLPSESTYVELIIARYLMDCEQLYGRMGQKLVDFGHSNFFGMALVVEEDIPPNPPAVVLFSPERVMFQANLVAQLVEKFFWK